MKIVVVDDSNSDLKRLKDILSKGFPDMEIVCYNNPRIFYEKKKLIDILNKDDIYALITDVYMLGGYSNVKELVTQLRKKNISIKKFFTKNLQEQKKFPIIAISKFVEKFTDTINKNDKNDKNDKYLVESKDFIIKELESTKLFLLKNEIPLIPKYSNELDSLLINTIKEYAKKINKPI